MDMNGFLRAEIDVIDELIRKAEAKLKAPAPRSRRDGAQRRDFADRVLDQFRERIAKYPDVPFSHQANPEIRRLVGALNILEDEHLDAFHDGLRNTSYNSGSREMIELEGRLRDMGRALAHDKIPPRLNRYVVLLAAFPRDYGAIDREEKAFLFEAGYLLHDMREVIARATETYPDLGVREREQLQVVDEYISGVIDDFRLKDFTRRNFQEGR
jgi:hypothetical protein